MSAANREKLNEVFATILEIDPAAVTDTLAADRLEQWDSLNHLNLCVALGQEFGIEFSTDEMAAARSVGDFIATLKNKGVAID